MGLNTNMPLAVVFGPAYLGRVGLRYLYVGQGCLKTSALIEHIQQNGCLGQMMWTAIQWAQVAAGVGFALLGKPERFPPLQPANGHCLFAAFLLTWNSHLRLSTHTQSVYAGSTTAFTWTTYWQGFTRIVKHKGSTDADITSKSNASQISVLLTASG
jgi:hypothetical protein